MPASASYRGSRRRVRTRTPHDAIRADLLRCLHRLDEAALYVAALSRTGNAVEREFQLRRLQWLNRREEICSWWKLRLGFLEGC